MQDPIRRTAAALAMAAFLALPGAPLTATAATGAPEPAGDVTAEAPSFASASYFDGNSWLDLPTMTGTFEGPAGGDSPTARLKADLGGPKTYFILAGAESQSKISIARPRIRIAATEAVAHRLQLAQFEMKDETRRTTIEITKNVAVFKRGSELDVTKVSEGLYEVRPKKSLQPGEYALAISESSPVADFTIVDRGY